MNPLPPKAKTRNARRLRHEQTPYERQLWEILRANRHSGFHFRRQHPVGPFIADFACISARLIVELDGNSHDERIERDAARDRLLSQLGWSVLRLPNVLVRDQPDDAWQMIEIELLKSGEEVQRRKLSGSLSREPGEG